MTLQAAISSEQLNANAETLRWILSTTSQGAAAFVAIVAGFLLSRILGISSMRQSHESRKAFLTKEIAMLDGEHSDLEHQLEKIDRDRFAKEHLQEIVNLRGDIELLHSRWTNAGVSPMPDFLHTKHFCDLVTTAFELLEQSFLGEDPLPTEIDSVIGENEVNRLSEYGILHKVTKSINSTRAVSMQKKNDAGIGNSVIGTGILGTLGAFAELNQMGSKYESSFKALSISGLNFALPDPKVIVMRKRYNELDDDLSKKYEEWDHLETEIERLKSTKGLKSSFVFVGIFGLVGVIVPQGVSLFDIKEPIVVGWWVLGAFTSLFIYLMLYMLAQLKIVKG